ncbi:MAG: PilZ domain-containing protein [Proteobacteria bacterium]|nr:PilZ domain-containing protein [Pseudomonadota bacterium]MBU1709795.1 PilZ domain-containing protein [Pseudomonadota bacterium]
MFTEKRKHSRLNIEIQAKLIFPDGQHFTGSTEDISFGGVFFTCPELAETTYRKNCLLQLILASGSDSDLILDIESKIVRATESGVGILFQSIEYTDYRHFEKIMVFNSPDPERLKEELEENPGLMVNTPTE